MSFYKGKLEAEDTPANGGGVVSNKKKLFCNITPIKTLGELNVKVRQYSGLKGQMQQPSGFGMKVKELMGRHTFFSAFSRFFNKHSATMNSAEAVTYEVDDALHIGTEAQLQGYDAEEMQPKEEEVKFSILARLVAYFRAPFQYVANIFFERLAKLISAFGVVAVGKKQLPFERVSEALEAKGAVASSQDSNVCELHAGMDSAPCSDDMQAISAFGVESMTEGESAVAEEVSAGMTTGLEVYAKAIAWGYMVIDGVLKIASSYEASQDGDVLYIGVTPATWISPVQSEEVLAVNQARWADQKQGILEVY